jgi:L-rhamnose mutarotase
MIRKAFVMQVDPAKHDEYERRHNPVWAEMLATLSAHGVRNYSIFLHRATSQLFAYAEIDSEERWRAIASTDVCRRWWSHMRDVMPANPDGSPLSTDLREVFHLA